MNTGLNTVTINITVDLTDFLAARNYSINDLFVTYCLNNKMIDLLKSFLSKKNDDQKGAFFQSMVRKQLIEKLSDLDNFDFDNYILTEKGELLLDETEENFTALDIAMTDVTLVSALSENENIPVSTINEFAQEFVELFPKGIKNRSGLYIRGNIEDVKNKLVSFMRKYKRYDKDLVLKATKHYLDKQKQSNYDFCSLSNYFISKNGTSLLATECEGILIKPEDLEKDLDGLHNQLM